MPGVLQGKLELLSKERERERERERDKRNCRFRNSL